MSQQAQAHLSVQDDPLLDFFEDRRLTTRAAGKEQQDLGTTSRHLFHCFQKKPLSLLVFLPTDVDDNLVGVREAESQPSLCASLGTRPFESAIPPTFDDSDPLRRESQVINRRLLGGLADGVKVCCQIAGRPGIDRCGQPVASRG